MAHKVKILDFERKSISVGKAQAILEKHLDEGYTIAGVCESNGFVCYTLVCIEKPSERALPPIYTCPLDRVGAACH